MIIGVAGYHASGKDLAASFIQELGYEQKSFTEEIELELKKNKLEFVRSNYVFQANKTRAEEGNAVYAKRIIKKMKKGKDYVITSFSHPDEVAELAKNPEFILFFVEASPKLRFERMVKRNKRGDPTNWKDFKKITQREEGKNSLQQLHKMKELADAVIVNEQSIEVFKKKIFKAVRDFEKKKKRGYSFNMKAIEQALESGKLIDPDFGKKHFKELKRLQPASYDCTISDEVIVLEGDYSLFVPDAKKTIRQQINEIPKYRKQSKKIEDIVLENNHNYLIKLEQKLKISKDEIVKNSPKSSTGRLFANTRLFADYNSGTDLVFGRETKGREVELWLLVQPMFFSIKAYKGAALTQIMFFNGLDYTISDSEILQLQETKGIILNKKTGKPIPSSNVKVNNGLVMHLDAIGKESKGVVALKAKLNPIPIDLRNHYTLPVEDYFDPILARSDGKIILEPGIPYIFSFLELAQIPTTHSAELDRHSAMSFEGPKDRAGFFDPGWYGVLVYEVISTENVTRELYHGMPVAKMIIYQNNDDTLEYGAEGYGTNYKYQIGPRTSKFWQLPNWEKLAELGKEIHNKNCRI